MIASARGTVTWAGLDRLVVEIGGVGLLVHTTPATAASAQVGRAVQLATSLVVREDSLTLYGFAQADERDVFEAVQTVSGVGPRLALAMLAVHPPDELRRALADGDVAALTRVPGIGRKGAERLVLELRDTVAAQLPTATPPTARDGSSPHRRQVHEALVGLGWSARQAESALDEVLASDAASAADEAAPPAAESTDVAALLRAALRTLAR